MRRSGDPIVEIATERRLLIPPENVEAFLLRTEYKSTALRRSVDSRLICFLDIPLMLPYNLRCSQALRVGNKISCCGQIPKFWRMYEIFSFTLLSRNTMSPEEGRIRPTTELMVVLLPHPLWPSKAHTFPGFTPKSTPLTAFTSLEMRGNPKLVLNAFLTFSKRKTSSSSGFLTMSYCLRTSSSISASSSSDFELLSAVTRFFPLKIVMPQKDGFNKNHGLCCTPVLLSRIASK
mmetsp:Transcript_777/g.2608  ORF Transcript_777/g.2608 Transcript_777/m.2608 type:complete len:234 (-) Transcript_777:1907-2608(-)